VQLTKAAMQELFTEFPHVQERYERFCSEACAAYARCEEATSQARSASGLPGLFGASGEVSNVTGASSAESPDPAESSPDEHERVRSTSDDDLPSAPVLDSVGHHFGRAQQEQDFHL
jgi:hypothetical protein